MSALHWMLLGAGMGFAQPDLPAFPGAEGFGAGAKGGRGGPVIPVTNLEEYARGEAPIEGSLRAAIETPGPRIVVFRVSGTIELEDGLKIAEPYLTIAGQTAPGGGICLKNYGVSVVAHDVVIRYLRVRPGDEVGRKRAAEGRAFETDAISIGTPARDVIIDHCSTSWANDEVLSVSGEGITNVTVQWCVISESLNDSTHVKGAHGYGSLLRCNGDVTFHHNLYAHHSSRCPRPGTYGEGSILLDFRNNVIHNGTGYSAADPVRMNYVANYIKRPRGSAFTVGGETTLIYVEGNRQEGENSGDPWAVIRKAEAVNKAPKPFPVAEVATDSAEDALAKVIESCGAVLPGRDAADQRLVEGLSGGTGDLIDSQDEVGGWPELESTDAPADTDGDGMPDAWETEHGLDPVDAADANGDLDGDGYLNIEEWLNGTA